MSIWLQVPYVYGAGSFVIIESISTAAVAN